MCAGHHIYYTHHPWEWQEFIRRSFPKQYAYVNKTRLELWDGTYPTEIVE